MAEHRDSTANQKEKKLIVASFVATVLVLAVVGLFLMPGRGVGYSPAQPIPFSHARHAGKRHIQCLYCHSNADKSPKANVPAVAVCMNCHRVVLVDSPWIKKLTEAYDNNTPIQWIKVHVLPDFVYFNHQRHVQRGLDCSQCHGNVPGMEQVEQVSPFTMGWCVNCHRKPENHAPLNCNTCHR
jgi:Cytochrome c7 and related cytochrome c